MTRIARFLALICCFAMSGMCEAAVNANAELSDRVESLLQSGQFGALDSMARSLRDSRFAGGDPKVYTFYTGLGAIREGGCDCSSQGTVPFAAKRQSLEKWLSANPKSTVAQTAMAMLWINDAWAARGHGYMSEVSPEQWHDYHDRLQTAYGYASRLDPKDDFFVLYEMSLLAEVTPSPRNTIMASYGIAVREDPAWFPFYARQARMLKEKWFGKPGEQVRFARSLLDKPGGDVGQSAYAEVATALSDGIFNNDGFEAVGGDWPALKRAYAVKEKRYRLSEEDAYALFQYAAVFHDQDAVAAALAHMRDYADQGYSLDMNNLGWAYVHGTGVPVQRDVAVSWYRKGAAQGNVVSQYQLGWILERTPGGGAEALKWYGLAGAQGDTTAVNNMGFMFEHGEGVTQDYLRAVSLYEDAAGKGDLRAEFHLGTLYDRGLGVAKDESLAVKWMTKAAEGGDHDARAWFRDRAKALAQPDNTL